jgi:hypothetical protein
MPTFKLEGIRIPETIVNSGKHAIVTLYVYPQGFIGNINLVKTDGIATLTDFYFFEIPPGTDQNLPFNPPNTLLPYLVYRDQFVDTYHYHSSGPRIGLPYVNREPAPPHLLHSWMGHYKLYLVLAPQGGDGTYIGSITVYYSP